MISKVQQKNNSGSAALKILQGGGILLFFTFISMPLGYATKMLNSRVLSLEEFGLFYSILAILGLLGRFNDFGLGYSLTYLIPKFEKKNQKKLTWWAYRYDQIVEFTTSCFYSAVLFLVADFLAKNYFNLEVASILLKILAINSIIDSLYSALQKLFIGLQKEIYYASMGPFKQFLTLLISYFFLLIGKGTVIWFSFAWIMGSVLSIITYHFLFKSKNMEYFLIPLEYNSGLVKKLWSYALPTLMVSSIGFVSASLDNILLIKFGGLTQVGAYNVIVPLASISTLLFRPLQSLLLPLFSELEDEPTRLKKVIESLAKIVPLLAIFFGLFVFMYPVATVSTIFGYKWAQTTAQPLAWAALLYILSPISNLFGSVANGIGIIRDKTKVSATSLLLKITLGTVGVIFFGIKGAIVVNGVIFLSDIVLFNMYSLRKIKYRLPTSSYVRMIVLSLGVYALFLFAGSEPKSLASVILTGISYSAVFIGGSYILKIISLNELLFIWNKISLIRTKNSKGVKITEIE